MELRDCPALLVKGHRRQRRPAYLYSCFVQDITVVRSFVLALVRTFGLQPDCQVSTSASALPREPLQRQQQRQQHHQQQGLVGPARQPGLPPHSVPSQAPASIRPTSFVPLRLPQPPLPLQQQQQTLAGPIPSLRCFLFEHAAHFWYELQRCVRMGYILCGLCDCVVRYGASMQVCMSAGLGIGT